GARRIPIAAILFWGGMGVGVLLSTITPEDSETSYRYVPMTMIFLGVLWFAATEFILLLRHRKRG
ncbi:MAG: hypothetical protein K9M02_17110, partial [Thiohalocapsa sp.]|nr:hypothetical protein [Thiohalocapsa sp.]